MSPKRLPLHEWHASNGAQFVDIAGWDVPNTYGKVDQEYAALRNSAGIADLSFEARYRIEGDDMLAFLNDLVTIELQTMEVGRCNTAFLCNSQGGIIDFVQIYRDEAYFLIMGNCRARQRTVEWFDEQRAAAAQKGLRVTFMDVSSAQGQFALFGPGSTGLLERITFGQRMTLDSGGAAVATIGTSRALVIRRPVGMMDAVDLIAGSVFLAALWDKLMEAARSSGARVVGAAAREILRVESGIPMHGAEIDPDTTPLELGLAVKVDMRKKKYAGRRALMHSTSIEFGRQMVMLKMEQDRPVDYNAEVLCDSLPIGRVTSSVLSPVMRTRLALGFANAGKALPGSRLLVACADGQYCPAEIIKPGAR